MSNVNSWFLRQQKRTVTEEATILTFRKVALSLVTIDGLTLMLSCMINVKLQNKEGEKQYVAHRNQSIQFTRLTKEKQTPRPSQRQTNTPCCK